MRKQKKKPQTNRGGTKLKVDGIIFKSLLEVYCYNKLKENNISAEYETHTFELIPAFTSKQFQNKSIRKMEYTPDFVGKNFIIEVKGYPNERFPLVWKIFLYSLHLTNKNVKIYKPRNTKEIDNMIKELKKNKVNV